MSNIVIYDKVTNRIKQYLLSVNEPDFFTRGDVLYDPDITLLEKIPLKYWKHVAGQIKEMTAQEKAIIDDEITATLLSYIRASGKELIDGYNSQGIILRAINNVTVDQFNTIRSWVMNFKTQVNLATSLADLKTRVAGLSDLSNINLSQVKTAIKNAIDSGIIDN